MAAALLDRVSPADVVSLVASRPEMPLVTMILTAASRGRDDAEGLMVDARTVRRIGAELPEARDESTEDYIRLTVRGKQFAWTYPERVEEGKPRVANKAVLVVRCTAADKESLLAADPQKFFTAPHYDGFPAVLVRLAEVGAPELHELLTDAWRCQVPKKLARELDDR